MLAEVLEHVRDRMARLSAAHEIVAVVPVREHRPLPPQQPIDAARDADRETLHPPAERARVLRFDQQVEMIAPDGEVHDPEVRSRARCSADRFPYHRERLLRSKVADAPRRPQRDVHRVPRLVGRAHGVGHP